MQTIRLRPSLRFLLAMVLFSVIAVARPGLHLGQRDPAAAQAAGDQFDSVRSYIHQAMEKEDIPSLTVAVAKGGKIIWEQGFGWANREKMLAATPDTMYSMASISKPFTATGFMRLVEDGKIDLDKPMNDYLGVGKLTGLASDASAATGRRVMSHTSGLPLHYQFFYENEGYAPPTMDETISRYGILVTSPGEVFEYSNLGYGILDYAAARTSGLDYADYMRTRVFIPLGLTHTSVGIADGLEPYAAQRYDSKQRPIPFYTFDHLGASAIYSSAHDLIRFGMFHLKDHLKDQQPILKDSTIDAMQQISTPPAAGGGGYALGWGIHEEYGYHVFGHTGGMPGVRTTLQLFPSEDLAVVVLTNRSNFAIDKIAKEVVAAVLPKYAAGLHQQPARLETPATSKLPADLNGEWTGTLRTWQRTIPLTLVLQPDGDIHVKFGDQLETLLNAVSFRDNQLTGRFAGNIPTPDAGRHRHSILVSLRLKNGKLTGYASAQNTEEPVHYALSSYVELSQKPNAHQ
jgi:CubicO group peptidase (beta-lactamase class C family)